MVLEGVKEKYESQKEIGFYPNNSSFILCDCTIKNNKYILKDIIPLSNYIGNIKINRNNVLLTDTDGNILCNFDAIKKNETAIEYVNENDIFISDYITYSLNFVFKKLYKSLNHYNYDKSFEKVYTLFDENSGQVNKFDLINLDTFLIGTNKDLKTSARLYSISKKDFITPSFRRLEEVEKTNCKIFKYTDTISSSITINDIGFSSSIIGFITANGKFYDGVYDELSNKEIECELNNKPNFEEYNELKKMIRGKLNEKVVKDSNKRMTKDFIIKKLENKAKNIIK